MEEKLHLGQIGPSAIENVSVGRDAVLQLGSSLCTHIKGTLELSMCACTTDMHLCVGDTCAPIKRIAHVTMSQCTHRQCVEILRARHE